jgi:predicted phage gp36 major capsid-like protein
LKVKQQEHVQLQQHHQQQQEFEELERKNTEAEEYMHTLLREKETRNAEELYKQASKVTGLWKYGANVGTESSTASSTCTSPNKASHSHIQITDNVNYDEDRAAITAILKSPNNSPKNSPVKPRFVYIRIYIYIYPCI